ncbi:MAG: hypothetical protein ACRDRS_25110 [Pseudonocardiaceae bacterium]
MTALDTRIVTGRTSPAIDLTTTTLAPSGLPTRLVTRSANPRLTPLRAPPDRATTRRNRSCSPAPRHHPHS